MASGFLFRGGPFELDTHTTKASTALAALDALTVTSGQLDIGVSGQKTVGVMLESKLVGDSATTAKQYIRAFPFRTKFVATTKSGTLAAASSHMSFRMTGATGAMGIAQGSTTVNDLYVYKVITTGTAGIAVVQFVNPSDFDAVVI